MNKTHRPLPPKYAPSHVRIKPKSLVIACNDPCFQYALNWNMNHRIGRGKWTLLPNFGGLTYCQDHTIHEGALATLWVWIEKSLIRFPSIGSITLIGHEGCLMADNYLRGRGNDMDFHTEAVNAGMSWLQNKAPNTAVAERMPGMRLEMLFLDRQGKLHDIPEIGTGTNRACAHPQSRSGLAHVSTTH